MKLTDPTSDTKDVTSSGTGLCVLLCNQGLIRCSLVFLCTIIAICRPRVVTGESGFDHSQIADCRT